ncbi:MAG: hypothetical protein IJB90_04525 [Clostridia bacterium]|nr:hypothetical protein [Clostridia bacterium]
MNLFNIITKRTTEVATKITREAKLKMEINENKAKIKELYEILGKKIYENHIRENKISTDEIIQEDCLSLDKLSKEIENARKELLKLNNKKMCRKCFAEIETEDNFCPRCGEKQTQEKTVFEKAEEKLQQSEILPQNKKEAEIVKEKLEQKNNN